MAQTIKSAKKITKKQVVKKPDIKKEQITSIDTNLPILTAIGFTQFDERKYVYYIVTLQGERIIDVKMSEPGKKNEVLSDMKTKFVQEFILKNAN